jgi:hypothetical protein
MARPSSAPTPPAPPKRKLTWLWVTLAVLGLLCAGGITVVALVAKGTVDAVNDVLATPSSRGVVEGQTPGETPGETKPTGPVTAKMGQSITVDATVFGTGDQVLTYTVANGRALRAPNTFEKPDHGQFYGVNLTVVVKAGNQFACSQDISFVAKDGTVYEPAITSHSGQFECVELHTGQRKAGLVVFDIPKAALNGGKIQIKAFWDDQPYGYWAL